MLVVPVPTGVCMCSSLQQLLCLRSLMMYRLLLTTNAYNLKGGNGLVCDVAQRSYAYKMDRTFTFIGIANYQAIGTLPLVGLSHSVFGRIRFDHGPITLQRH